MTTPDDVAALWVERSQRTVQRAILRDKFQMAMQDEANLMECLVGADVGPLIDRLVLLAVPEPDAPELPKAGDELRRAARELKEKLGVHTTEVTDLIRWLDGFLETDATPVQEGVAVPVVMAQCPSCGVFASELAAHECVQATTVLCQARPYLPEGSAVVDAQCTLPMGHEGFHQCAAPSLAWISVVDHNPPLMVGANSTPSWASIAQTPATSTHEELCVMVTWLRHENERVQTAHRDLEQTLRDVEKRERDWRAVIGALVRERGGSMHLQTRAILETDPDDLTWKVPDEFGSERSFALRSMCQDLGVAPPKDPLQ